MFKQDLRVKDSCIKLHAWSQELPMKPNPICFTEQKLFDLRMREREILRRKGLMKSIYKPMLRNPPLLGVALCLSFFLFFLSLLCVCNCSLFLFPLLPFFSSFSFFLVRDSLYLQRSSKETVPFFSSQLISSWRSLHQFFSPQLLILCSAVPTIQLFALFIHSVPF